MSKRAITFTIAGRIGGKGRARGFIRGGHVAMHTPEKTVSQEAIVRTVCAAEMRRDAISMLDGPLAISVHVARIYPKSWSKRQREQVFVTGKPDYDNTLKLIGDALNGIAYGDDSQIARSFFERRYVQDGGESVRVVMEELT